MSVLDDGFEAQAKAMREAAAKAYDDEANSFMYGASSECLPMPRADLQLSNIRGIVQP